MSKCISIFFVASFAYSLFCACCRATRVAECGNFLIGRIRTAVSLARDIFFPSFFGASRFLSVVSFQIVPECVDFLIGRISTTVTFASVIRMPTFFGASCGLSCMVFYVMSQGVSVFFVTSFARCLLGAGCRAAGMTECGNFFIRCMVTPFAFAGYVFFPTFFGARCRLPGMVFQIMSKCRNFGLCLQYFSAL